MKFIKHYSLEIYTVISLSVITFSAIWIQPDMAQKIILAFIFLFVLHEWEEGHYPGGFLELIAKLATGRADGIAPELSKGSRLYTGLYLSALTFIPLILHEYTWLVLPAAFLSVLEGFVHIMGIKLFRLKKPYTPGMITAECECLFALCVFCYLGRHHYVRPIHYLFGFLLMLFGFMCMQRKLVHTIGKRYRDLPSMIRRTIRELKASN